MAIRGARPDEGQICPHLLVRGAARASAFYAKAFGAVELYRSPLPHSNGEHIQTRIGKTLVKLTDEDMDRGTQSQGMASPETLGASTVMLDLVVADVDAAFQRATDAGCKPWLPPMDMFWGDRYGVVGDPFGHLWSLTQVKEVVAPDEIARRMQEFMEQAGDGSAHSGCDTTKQGGHA